MMVGWSMSGWNWAWMVVMMVGGVAVLAQVISVLAPRGGCDRRRPDDDPRRILDARSDRGEIGADEYQRARALLAPPTPAAGLAATPADPGNADKTNP